MRRALLAIVAMFALLASALIPASSAPLLSSADPVPTCVKPSSSPTHQQQVNYAECLQKRTEAMLINLHPVPTVTETVTATATATATVTETATASPTATPTSTPTPTPTPTESPSPTPPPTTTDFKGWDLTTTNVGLTPHGLTCAALPVYSGPNVIPAGTTISEKRFSAQIDVSAGGIVIEKSCFRPTSADVGLVEGYYPQGDITIRDSEFDGSLLTPGVREGACGFTGGANVLRNYVHDVGRGICMVSSTNTRDQGSIPEHILVKNNFVHRMFHCCGAHHEAGDIRDFVKNAANTRTMRWVGNWLDITQTEFVSAGMFIQPTFEPIHNVWLSDNVFAGEGWNFDVHDSSGINVVRNLHVVNNRFKAGVREYYGPVSAGTAGIVEWADNHVYDASQPDARGALVNP